MQERRKLELEADMTQPARVDFISYNNTKYGHADGIHVDDISLVSDTDDGEYIQGSESYGFPWDISSDSEQMGSHDNATHARINATAVERNEDLAKVEITVLSAIFALAVLGNSIVLLVLRCQRRKLSRMNLLIVHLSVADLFVAFFNVLPQLIWDVTFKFYGNDFLCRFVAYVQVFGMYASSYVLVTTAVDRYLAICQPLASHTMTTTRIHVFVAIAWVLSTIFSIPQVFIFAQREYQSGSGEYSCLARFEPGWTEKLYITWFTMAVYIIPLFILVGAYGCICHTVWTTTVKQSSSSGSKRLSTKDSNKALSTNYSPIPNRHQPMRNGVTSSQKKLYKRVMRVDDRGRIRLNLSATGTHAHGRSMTKSKVKTVKLTLTVIICYLTCWAPFFVTQLWSTWDHKAPFESRAMVIILLLASLNSCTNPWIYMAFSDNLCDHLGRCLGRKPRRRAFHRGPTWDSSIRWKSSVISRTEVTRYEAGHDARGLPLTQMPPKKNDSNNARFS